jgi:hypothetical protein
MHKNKHTNSVRCRDCTRPEILITNKGRKAWCPKLHKWIGKRSYDRPRQCAYHQRNEAKIGIDR